MSRLDDLLNELPADCRAACKNALLICAKVDTVPSEAAKAAIEGLVTSVHRTQQRRASDRRTDRRRRKLVGARVSIADYWRYRRAADAEGLSLYQWIYNALDAAYMGGEND